MPIYERLRESRIYDFYWSIADKDVLDAIRRELEFYRTLLVGFRRGDLVFDIGANQGAKTSIFLRLGAKVVAVDPDEANQRSLGRKFLRYRIQKKPVRIVGKAVSDHDGIESFWIDEPGGGKNSLSVKWIETLRNDHERFGKKLLFEEVAKVATTTLEELISTYGRPFFIKIDVEGHELKVLAGLQQRVPYLSFEINLPEFRSEGLRCVRRLEEIMPNGRFNYVINSRPELGSQCWVDAREFANIVEHIAERSIEVIWKT